MEIVVQPRIGDISELSIDLQAKNSTGIKIKDHLRTHDENNKSWKKGLVFKENS